MPVAPDMGVFPENGVHLIPHLLCDDAIVFSGVGSALVDGFAEIKAAVQDLVDDPLVDEPSSLVPDALSLQHAGQCRRRAEVDELLEDQPYDLGFRFVDHQLSIFDFVAHRDVAAHPHAPLARGGELVADALANHLALELCKGQENVEGEAAHGACGVERLRDRNKGHAVAL